MIEVYHKVKREDRKRVLNIMIGMHIPTMEAQDIPSMVCSGTSSIGNSFGGCERAALCCWRGAKN